MIKSITQSASLLTTCRLTLHLEQQKQSEIVHTLICKLSRFEDSTLFKIRKLYLNIFVDSLY